MQRLGVRLLVLVGVIATLVVVVNLTRLPNTGPRLTRANILKVKPGMTDAAVREVLGWPVRTESHPKLSTSELALQQSVRAMVGPAPTKIDNYNAMTQAWEEKGVKLTIRFRDKADDSAYRVTDVKAEGIELYQVIDAVDMALMREATGVVARVTNNSGGDLKDITLQVWGYRAGNTRAVTGETHLASWPAGAVARVELAAVDQAELVLVSVRGDAAPADENALVPRVSREWRSLKVE